MDDFVISNLHESRNEWCSRLVSVLSPMVMEGIKSIYNEAWNMCVSSNEKSKYLMTFQNLLSRIPKWNSTLIEEERKRIIEKSGCTYLEDLITCVHVIQLKILTCIRVGNKQKKIDISVPKLDHFLHRVYIMVARKCYSNVYLFERGVSDLNLQRNNRELEVMVQECILCAIRESIPTESIIRAYMDEAVEDEEEVIIEPIKEEEEEPTTVKDGEKKEGEETDENKAAKELPEEDIAPTLGVEDLSNETPVTRLTFNDTDEMSDGTKIDAPKTIERLEEISEVRSNERNMEDDSDDDDDGSLDGPSIKIHMDEDVKLNDVFNLDKPLEEDTNIILDDIEEL
jgi:hypothetical protein